MKDTVLSPIWYRDGEERDDGGGYKQDGHDGVVEVLVVGCVWPWLLLRCALSRFVFILVLQRYMNNYARYARISTGEQRQVLPGSEDHHKLHHANVNSAVQ